MNWYSNRKYGNKPPCLHLSQQLVRRLPLRQVFRHHSFLWISRTRSKHQDNNVGWDYTTNDDRSSQLLIPRRPPPFSAELGTTGAPHSNPLPFCLMLESFIGFGELEDHLQQFDTAAFLSGGCFITHDNRPHYFVLRFRQNALHFLITLSAAWQTDFTLLVDAFRHNYPTNVDVLKARLRAARQQPNQDIASTLCDVWLFAFRAYRAFRHLLDQYILMNFIEVLSDSTLRWELRIERENQQQLMTRLPRLWS